MTKPHRQPGTSIQYSEVAADQLDALKSADPGLHADILTVCELVFTHPERAQGMSAAVRTEQGIVMRLAVPGRHPFKVFWSTALPRIEAVFPYPG
ncbi:MAG: hypothetical protein ACKODP_08050 [Actinomycetota bacterium]